ncbi:MAG TPA: RnfH family protein [Rubrivivax sp.]|nr:RnfH family protein [Rubrivivax sp.]
MAPAEPGLRVEVVYCPKPGQTELVQLQMPPGATLADALHASGLLQRHALRKDDLSVGIWGRVQASATPLRDRDRVEIYRPLQVDPKEARRERYRHQRLKPGDGR